MTMYLIIGAAALALIYFVYLMVKPEKEVEETEEDQMIFDPVTGSKMTYEEAVKGKVFIDPTVNDGVSAIEDTAEEYDLDKAYKVVSENIPEEISSKVSEDQIKIILQIQGAYMMTVSGDISQEENVKNILETLDNLGNDILTYSDIEKILKAEEIYLKEIGALVDNK